MDVHLRRIQQHTATSPHYLRDVRGRDRVPRSDPETATVLSDSAQEAAPASCRLPCGAQRWIVNRSLLIDSISPPIARPLSIIPPELLELWVALLKAEAVNGVGRGVNLN
ncbi:hypothetical protein X949_5195 [Burkholderia pseudomallei MSHR5609]|nr:hypothetical protein X949_5195 [Burkholderia pseudomallei MSHR5609]